MDFEVHTPEAGKTLLALSPELPVPLLLGQEWLALCKHGPTAGKPQAPPPHAILHLFQSRWFVKYWK